MEQKKFDKAIEKFETALKHQDYYNKCMIYNNIAWSYSEMNKLDDALQAYNCAMQEYPKCIKALLNRAKLYVKRKEFDLALADYETVLQHDRYMAVAYLERGYIYECHYYAPKPTEMANTTLEQLKEKRKFAVDKALQEYYKALEADPQCKYTYFFLCITKYDECKNVAQSMEWIHRGLNTCYKVQDIAYIMTKMNEFFAIHQQSVTFEQAMALKCKFFDSRIHAQVKTRLKQALQQCVYSDVIVKCSKK